MERTDNGRVTRIARGEYVDVTGDLQHVFLVGDLKEPTVHPFIRDDRLEIMVCRYAPGDHGRHHWHPSVTEYEMVTEGEVDYFEVATGETHAFKAGDLSLIPPTVCTRRLAPSGATTIAIKVPSSAGKVHCLECPRDCAYRTEPNRGGLASG